MGATDLAIGMGVAFPIFVIVGVRARRRRGAP